MYLLIEVGYEGIDELIYLTDDPKKILDVRKRAINWKIAESNYRARAKRWGMKRWRTDKELSERFCIMRWEGHRFECVCREFGIGNGTILY